jgi:hypothetical protein
MLALCVSRASFLVVVKCVTCVFGNYYKASTMNMCVSKKTDNFIM